MLNQVEIVGIGATIAIQVPQGERVVTSVVDVVDVDVRGERTINTFLGANETKIAINILRDPDDVIELVNNTRRSEGRGDTRKSGAITEILVIALKS